MARTYLKYAIKHKIYRVDGKHLGNKKYKRPHDVIVVGVNKRNKTCKVKVITSLESKFKDDDGNLFWGFINDKLPGVRSGKYTVVPAHELGTHHLSCINNVPVTLKWSKMYLSTTGTKFPRRFKNIIKLKKRKDIIKDIPDKFHY